MKLAALRMFNVKRFAGQGVAIEGIGEGVNVLCAANEVGKSTSFEALHSLFFQPHSSTAGDVRNLRPYSGGNPLVEVDVETDEARYRITKQFYGGRFAKVVDLESGRTLAQADEAERFIGDLLRGGASGPAGLLWVRQGITGIERRSRSEEESDKQVRASLLESVQGEVEAVTGGRRMTEIMAAALEEQEALVTPTGRPKAGGRYAAAVEARDRLAADERRLANEVAALREALDQRGVAQRRLTELENADERAQRREAVETAQAAFDAARAQSDKLKTAEAELGLARERRDAVERERGQFADALAEARIVAEESREVAKHRTEAMDRRSEAQGRIARAQVDADAAEADERAARASLHRLEAAARARSAAEQRAEMEERLLRADEARSAFEQHEARLAQERLPAGAVDELADLDIKIAGIRAVHDAKRPSVTIAYDGAGSALVTMGDTTLKDGEERTYDGQTQLIAPGIGTITLRSNRPELVDDGLQAAESQRGTLLASMGVEDLAAARAQQVRAQNIEAQMSEARAQLAALAPEGLEILREKVAALNPVDSASEELAADPTQVREALDRAEERRIQAVQTLRATEPTRALAEDAFVAAETELARLQTRGQQADAVLGPAEDRERREQDLVDRLAKLDASLTQAQAFVDDQRTTARDFDATEAALQRVRSVEQAADTEIQQLREALAGLTAQIGARSDEAVEENWRETSEALVAAQTRVAAFEREVAVLTRLIEALEAARSNARDLYLTPVMSELRPLLGLLFDDVAITFDERTLLPQTILRGGQEEEVERLSGGMREQLSILTRLAFARLLARDGRPAPVILDDALVYSDDDRIERMFDALHRQSRDQQIIVFSCRQRAFQKLGGNILQMTEWRPS